MGNFRFLHKEWPDIYRERFVVKMNLRWVLENSSGDKAFSEFLQAGNLQAEQMTFINNIIMHLVKNGTIEPGMLFEPPFTDVNDQGLLGVFDDAEATRMLSILARINENAEVA